MRFFLGTHQPSWLARDLGVPLLVSHRRLADRRSLPRATGPWACDSGGFTELSMHGRWRIDERGYVAALRRYANEISNLAWAAPMDHMTESHVLARTGATVRVHQHRTVANYLRLRDLAPELPIIPVLQGQSIADYNRCADFYERHGVDLAALPLVGVAVCAAVSTPRKSSRSCGRCPLAGTACTPSGRRCSDWAAMPTRSPAVTRRPGVSEAGMCPAALPATAANPTACASRWHGIPGF